jgi:hypothetical protein
MSPARLGKRRPRCSPIAWSLGLHQATISGKGGGANGKPLPVGWALAGTASLPRAVLGGRLDGRV